MKEEELFAMAISLSPAELDAFLERHCASQSELRRRIERLLKAHRETNLLDKPIESFVHDAGSIIAEFELERQQGKQPDIHEWLRRVSSDEQARLRGELIASEIRYRRQLKENPSQDEYRKRFPEMGSDELTHLLGKGPARSPPANEATGKTQDFVNSEKIAAHAAEFVDEEGIGAVLSGKYKLVEAIGEGGMGSVFLAQQTAPVKRLVAVKIIKAGMDSKAVLARFDAERQALAMMEHTNIAKVLDAGTTERRRPFFVMELVKGVPITQFCDERQINLRGRIELFIQVCQAIQHAHQKGIIHRDIKPSNVLVAMYDDVPVPKVIDFGLAKATGQQLTEATLVTGLGAVVGTPEYMSPEQASFNQLDVDTRTDVYSLGVLLYELLTGSTPVDRKSLRKAALLEILRIVREVDAPLPSSRLSSSEALPSIAAKRGTDPHRLSKMLRGELDWIASKSLEKNRNRRYDTANGLAHDLQRYLVNGVVEARPITNRYRLQKLVLRNKGRFIAAAGLLLVLLLGIIGTGVGLVRALVAENEIQLEHTKTLAALDVAEKEKVKAESAAKLEKEAASKEKLAAERELIASKRAQQGELEANLQAVRANTTAYAAQLLTIQSLVAQGDLPGALRILNECPWELRHWEYDWLTGQVLNRVRLLTGHRKPVKALAFTHDGKSILSGSQDGTARIWDIATGDQRMVYRGHLRNGFGPHAIAVLPGDERILSVGWSGSGGELNLWSLADGITSIQQIGMSSQEALGSWTSSANGKRIAILHGSLPKAWESATGNKIDLHFPTLRFDTLAMNEDGALLAASEIGSNGIVGVWKLDSGEEVFRVPKPAKIVSYDKLFFCPQGKQLVCCSDRGDVDILEAHTGVQIAHIQGSGPITFSPNGSMAARKTGGPKSLFL